MGHEASFRSKAAHFVSDLTTVILNPIADELPKPQNEVSHKEETARDQISAEEDSNVPSDGPDTSSFPAFLLSLLSSTEKNSNGEVLESESVLKPEEKQGREEIESSSYSRSHERQKRKSLISFSKRSVKKVIKQVARISGYAYQNSEGKADSNMEIDGHELKPVEDLKDTGPKPALPDISEPSILLSEKIRSELYMSLPSLVRERKWVLLYSTWRHGVSLSTLYRRSMLCPGYSLLVVGDRKGAVFGGLVEVPLRPTSKRKYQGTNNTFVFTNLAGNVVVYRPTGANRYFTACSTDFLALGGGGHFALYLDGDLLAGSSSASETFENACLAHSQDFEVKEVELWGFAYASKYDEILALCRTEAPGICRW